MVTEGVDYAFEVPTVASLVMAGKKFAVRYGGPGTSDKHLTGDELRRLTNAGILVVANAEGASGGFRGYANGRSWAQSAEQHFRGLGMPADRPIYFSVDFDANPSDWPDIDSACDGAANVIGRDRVGIYGSIATIGHVYSAGKAKWYWQTYAWSRGLWHPVNHLEQYRNGVTIGGANLDLTRAMRSDYGQWGVDVNVDDLVKDSSEDGIPETPLGHWTLSQGVPDGTRGGQRTAAWQVIQNLGAQVVGIRSDLSAARSTIAALKAELDSLAARPPATVSQDDLKAAIVAAFHEIFGPHVA